MPEEVTKKVEDINIPTNNDDVSMKNISTPVVLDVDETSNVLLSPSKNSVNNTETQSSLIPSSTQTLEEQSQNTDVSNILEDTNSAKKITDEESLKPGKTIFLIKINCGYYFVFSKY